MKKSKEEKFQEKEAKAKNSGFVYKTRWQGVIRIFVATIILLLELGLFFTLALRLSQFGLILLISMQVVGLLFVFRLFYVRRDITYTIGWSLVILSFPAFGLILYFFWGRRKRFRDREQRLNSASLRLSRWFPEMPKTQQILNYARLAFKEENLQLNYLANRGFPLYRGCSCRYYKDGESQVDQIFRDLESAEDYIFLEYFILSDGLLWKRVEDILIEKAEKGIKIRILYDDFGSSTKTPPRLHERLREKGIEVINFNPVLSLFSGFYVNYRNHQKVLVIDGSIAWFGGANLADEYVNLHERFGHWKDSALRVEGEAASAAAVYFLEMWSMDKRVPVGQDESIFFKRKDKHEPLAKVNSIVSPYRDGPLGNPDNPAEDLYRSLINTAQRSLYITTPYFIVDASMIADLCRVARSGVDVRLLIPGIPDKKNVYLVTRSNIGALLEAGVRVYEYSPGFIHSKVMLADGSRGIIGSINLDFRSLYLNFENAIYIYRDPVLKDMEKDFIDSIRQSKEISYEEWQRRPLKDKIREPIYKIFSPLL